MYFKLDVKNWTSTLKMSPNEREQALTTLIATYKTAALIEKQVVREFVERACLQHINEVFEGTQPVAKPVVKPKKQKQKDYRWTSN